MKLPQKIYPAAYVHKANPLSPKFVHLPFQLVRCGYSNEKHINFEADYQEYLIFYILDGTAQYTKQRDIRYINRDHILISSCNARISLSKATPRWRYFYAVFSGTHAKLFYNMIRDMSNIFPITPIHNICPVFTELCDLDYQEEIFCQMQAYYLLHQLIHELILIAVDINKARMATPIQQTVVNMALKYIDEHYQEDLSVDRICQTVSFSKYYFCKLFKEHTGKTLHQYVTEYRVNKSKDLLTYSKLPIHAIAIEVGFQNSLAYTRAFKQYSHMTPSEYRKTF